MMDVGVGGVVLFALAVVLGAVVLLGLVIWGFVSLIVTARRLTEIRNDQRLRALVEDRRRFEETRQR